MSPIHRHVGNPISMGKNTAHDANDGDDDEMQRFSKWGGHSPQMGDVRWAEALGAQARQSPSPGCPTPPLGAGNARQTSLHKDLDLLLAEGILPLPFLVGDPRRGSKWCASSSAPSLSESRFPTRKPSSAFESTSVCEVSTSSPLMLRALWLLGHHLPQGSHFAPEGSPERDCRCQGWRQVKVEGRQSPLRFLGRP